MARGITMLAEAPNAATARNRASQPMEGASAQPMVASVNSAVPTMQWTAPAEAVGQRALGDLPDGQAGEPGGQGELRGARGACRSECLHRRERRQVHVGGGRPDGDEEAEQGREPGGRFHAVGVLAAVGSKSTTCCDTLALAEVILAVPARRIQEILDRTTRKCSCDL